MKPLRIIIALAITLCTALATAAQVNIHGKVTDEANSPVEFVTVKVAGTALGTQTNLQGDFRLSVPQTDTLRVTFTCIGYREETRTLIKPKGDITLNMRLLEDTKALGEVEVQAIKAQTSQMQTVSPTDVRRLPDASGGQVESVITTLAGVSASNELSSQYSVRGGSYDENSVYINGIEVYRPQLITSGQQEGLSIINPDMVGSVNFSTGGFPAKYADKMSSVLDITYRQPEALEGSVSASLMGGSVSFGQSSKKFSQLYGVRYKANNSLLSSLEDKGEYDPKYFDFQTSLNYQPSSRLKFGFLGNVSINDYKFTPQNRETKFGTAQDPRTFQVYFDGREKDKFETWFGALTADWKASKGTTLSLLASGFLSNELVTYDIAGEYWIKDTSSGDDASVGAEDGIGRYMEHARNRLKSQVLSIGLQGSSKIGAKNTLEYGLTVRSEKVMERSREWEKRDSAGYSLPSDGEHVRLIYNLQSTQDLTSTRINGFIQDTWRHQWDGGYLSINGGLRMSYWSFNKEFLVSPRINVGYVPSKWDKWTFRFATGLYYQSPFYKEMRLAQTDAAGNRSITLNSDIKSQQSYQVILGSDFTFRFANRPFKLSMEAYYKALSKLIPYTLDNLRIVYAGTNSTTGHVAGVDMRLFGQFVPGSDSWLSVSLLNAREKMNGVSVPRPNERRYNLALFFTDYFPKLPKLKFSLKGIFSDGLPLTAPRQTMDQGYFRTPAYKRLDVGISYGLVTPKPEGEPRTGIHRYVKSIWVGVDCFNLFDISNVSSYYWVTDVNNDAYAVPNYLTRRQFNVRLTIDF